MQRAAYRIVLAPTMCNSLSVRHGLLMQHEDLQAPTAQDTHLAQVNDDVRSSIELLARQLDQQSRVQPVPDIAGIGRAYRPGLARIFVDLASSWWQRREDRHPLAATARQFLENDIESNATLRVEVNPRVKPLSWPERNRKFPARNPQLR